MIEVNSARDLREVFRNYVEKGKFVTFKMFYEDNDMTFYSIMSIEKVCDKYHTNVLGLAGRGINYDSIIDMYLALVEAYDLK